MLAVGVIGYATLHKGTASTNGGYTNPEIADAKAIPGVIYKPEPNHNHVEGNITYDTSPPVGGNHSQYWADCSGTVYPNAIANENAVHMLEHGAVWITYKPGLAADQVATLAKLVHGRRPDGDEPVPGPEDQHLAAGVGLPALRRLGQRSADQAVHPGAEVQPEDDAGGQRDLLAADVHRATRARSATRSGLPVDANASASVVPHRSAVDTAVGHRHRRRQ